ncbi:MAG: flavin-dependent monooxygenase [Betaproteobacteria bacterium]|nr:flavin-dependent monooxygenase [Betaproteobacteria bacterium]
MTSPSHDIGAELLRRLPDETIADLRRTELLKAARPKRFGGFALDLDQVMAIIAELGRGCGSTGWVFGVYCDHYITLGMFPAAMQEDVRAKQPDALISTGLAPGGTIQRTAGGYRLSGRWSYSSGCTHADWAFVHTPLPAADGAAPPDSLYVFVPRADFHIIDIWEVMGLCGTGSNDLDINDAFIPSHCTLRVSDANEGTGPGITYNDAALYRLPRAATVPYCLGAPILGIAQAMYDDFVDNMRPRASRGFPLAEQQTIQLRVAEAAAEIDAARLLLQRDCKESMRAIRERGKLTMEERARNRRDMGYCVKLCGQASERMFAVTGGAGIYLNTDMQRLYRDASL